MSEKDIVKELHYTNLHTVAALLTLAEAHLVASGRSADEARSMLQASLEFWENQKRDDLGRLLG